MGESLGILSVKGLKQRACVGWTQQERSYPQLVGLDLNVTLDIAPCVASDDLKDTVDYMALVQVVESLLNENSWKLVEKMAHDIAGTILSRFQRTRDIEVTVTKSVVGNSAGFSTTVKLTRS